jgi:hypothetical protein
MAIRDPKAIKNTERVLYKTGAALLLMVPLLDTRPTGTAQG